MPNTRTGSPSFPSDLPGLASGSLLVLLPDTEARDGYEFANDEEGDEQDDPIPSLPPSVVFLYLLSPYLRLGAMNIPDGDLPLNYGLATLAIAALLSAFCRHIWFLLGQYLRKHTAEDILIEAFTRGGDKEHVFARRTISSINGLFRVLLASLYLSDSVDCLLPFVPETIQPLRSRLSASVLLGFLVLLCTSRSLATKQAIHTTIFSLASYMVWLIALSHAYTTYGLPRSHNPSQRGVLWNEISSIAFACTTTLTLPLSASLTAGQTATSASQNGASSFQLLSTSSSVLAAMLMLPSVVFASSSSNSETSGTTPDLLISLLRMSTLMMSVPTIMASIPALPLHQVVHHVTPVDPTRLLVTCVVVAFSLASSSIACILNDAVLFLTVSGTFLLPALAHITIHYFRRPLSIVVPQVSQSSQSQLSRPSSPDPLLRRKERLLQRRRLGKRLLWDIGVWIILLPVCGCASVWAGGRLAQQW